MMAVYAFRVLGGLQHRQQKKAPKIQRLGKDNERNKL